MLTDTTIPITANGDCPDWTSTMEVPIEALSLRTPQHWMIRQPVKMGGLGIRSCEETSPAAFIGGLEQALPHLTGDQGVCKVLTRIIGDCDGMLRWQQLLQSGCRTGQELARSWAEMQLEAQQCAGFLGQETRGPLTQPVEQAGDGCRTGATRGLLVSAREEVRAAVMKEAIPRIKAPQARRLVMAYKNRDKLTSAWVTCLPGPEGLSGPAFTEAICSLLCLPSPACRSRVGAKVGKKTVDIYGDNIQAATLPGDDWRTRHDTVKMCINSLCNWARLPATCEVWNLFAHLIPGEALSRIETGRKRQALVPDFRIEMPGLLANGATEYKLAELKILSCCDTWYKSSPRSNVRAVEKRAQGLPQDYRRKARKVDETISEPTHNTKGPVESRLDEFGLWRGARSLLWRMERGE